jgi:hypothetical protein
MRVDELDARDDAFERDVVVEIEVGDSMVGVQGAWNGKIGDRHVVPELHFCLR